MLFPEKCFNFGEKYNILGKFFGVCGKIFLYLGKIGVCLETFFDSQNGTLTENFLATGGGRGGRRSGTKGGQKWPIDGGPPAVALRHCPVSTKFPINIEHVILTNRMFFVFRIATFLAGKINS
jgi:hypothetical protein